MNEGVSIDFLKLLLRKYLKTNTGDKVSMPRNRNKRKEGKWDKRKRQKRRKRRKKKKIEKRKEEKHSLLQKKFGL